MKKVISNASPLIAFDKWIEVRKVKNLNEIEALRAILDYGESEVIALAQEIKADLLILDNKEPRIFAKHLGFKLIGTKQLNSYK